MSDDELAHEEQLSAQLGFVKPLLLINRATPIKLYVLTIIVALWLITLLLLAVTIKAVFYRYRIDIAVLMAPVATLFAFTTLRTSMPGAPSNFGSIIGTSCMIVPMQTVADFVGTLSAFAILVFVAVLCMLHVLILSRRKMGPTDYI